MENQKQVQELYNEINQKFLNHPSFNNKQTREEVRSYLINNLDENVIVKCDEEINAPDVIDYNILIAEIYCQKPNNFQVNHVYELFFGNPENIIKYQATHKLLKV